MDAYLTNGISIHFVYLKRLSESTCRPHCDSGDQVSCNFKRNWILILKTIRQDLLDLTGFSFLSQFPEETEKTQSDFVGKKYC